MHTTASDLPPQGISLPTLVALSGRSLRTWQRRVEEGAVPSLRDASGRTLVPLAALAALPDLQGGSWSAADLQLLLHADGGAPQALAELGARFALQALEAHRSSGGGGGQDHTRCAQFFLGKAADLGEADAMHWLGLLAAAGAHEGGSPDPALALMWLAKASTQGHAIAQAQVQALLAGLPKG